MHHRLEPEKLDARISKIVARGSAAHTGDEHLDTLGRLALGLRGLPRPEFRTALRDRFEPNHPAISGNGRFMRNVRRAWRWRPWFRPRTW